MWTWTFDYIQSNIFYLVTYQKQTKYLLNFTFTITKMSWNSFHFHEKKYAPLERSIFTSHNWMSVLKICMYNENAGGFIRYHFQYLYHYKWITLTWWQLLGEKVRFLHPVCDLERNFNHTTYINTCGRTSEKRIGEKKQFQSCASFGFWSFCQMIWNNMNWMK